MTDEDTLRVRLRPEIVAVPAYKQGRPAPADGFKLSSNENPYPPLPSVVEAVTATLAGQIDVPVYYTASWGGAVAISLLPASFLRARSR